MAQVRFYAASFDFTIVKAWYDRGDLAIIFQMENEDSNSNRDEFVLVAYPVDSAGKVLPDQLRKLAVNTNFTYQAKDQLLLGNLPLNRSKIQRFVEAYVREPFDNLFFDPTYKKGKPMKYKDYVSYLITSSKDGQIIESNAANYAAEELHPSPPAQP